MRNLINMILMQNPQLRNIDPATAKQQFMQMLNNGQINQQYIQNLKMFAQQYGIENQVNQALSQIDLTKVQQAPRKNRW